MKNYKITASISIDEQGKIMGGTEIGPKPKPKTVIEQIKDSLKPTPTFPILPVIISY